MGRSGLEGAEEGWVGGGEKLPGASCADAGLGQRAGERWGVGVLMVREPILCWGPGGCRSQPCASVTGELARSCKKGERGRNVQDC